MKTRFILLALSTLPMAGCGRSDAPPPLTGNLTDVRGAHAGSFRTADAGPGDYGNAAGAIHAGQGAPTIERVHPADGAPK